MKVLEVCGFRVVLLQLPNRIASIRAIANATGSLFESTPNHQGAAHFLEHMFFKGTANRSYSEVALLLDELGDHNASTSFNDTKFYINCRTAKWPQAFTVLCELLFESKFDEAEFQKERAVILEELVSRDDDPVSYFQDWMMQSVYGISSIGGSVETVANMTSAHLAEHRQLYDRANTFFVISGNINEEDAARECAAVLGKYQLGLGEQRSRKKLEFNSDKLVLNHPAQQGIFAILMEGMTEEESIQNNLVDMLFSNGFGGASSSLLFERIRQELGLCYQISNDSRDIGERELNISWGLTSRKNLYNAVEEVGNVLNQVRKHGFGNRLSTYKENLYHHIDSVAERSSSSASVFGDSLLSHKYHLTADEMVAMLEKVEDRHIMEYANLLGSNSGDKLVVMGEK